MMLTSRLSVASVGSIAVFGGTGYLVKILIFRHLDEIEKDTEGYTRQPFSNFTA
jgi:hypothetical protein